MSVLIAVIVSLVLTVGVISVKLAQTVWGKSNSASAADTEIDPKVEGSHVPFEALENRSTVEPILLAVGTHNKTIV